VVTSTLLTDFDQRRSSEVARLFSLFNTDALFVRTYVRRTGEINRLWSRRKTRGWSGVRDPFICNLALCEDEILASCAARFLPGEYAANSRCCMARDGVWILRRGEISFYLKRESNHGLSVALSIRWILYKSAISGRRDDFLAILILGWEVPISAPGSKTIYSREGNFLFLRTRSPDLRCFVPHNL